MDNKYFKGEKMTIETLLNEILELYFLGEQCSSAIKIIKKKYNWRG